MAPVTSCSAVLAFLCWSLRGPLLAGRRCLCYRSCGFWFLTSVFLSRCAFCVETFWFRAFWHSLTGFMLNL